MPVQATTPCLNKRLRSKDEVLALIAGYDCGAATRRRVCAHGGINRRILMVAQDHMRAMLDAALLPARPGLPYPNDVPITGRLTARQWSRALCIPEFAAADYHDRRPEDHPRIRTRHWLDIDWLRDAGLPGATTTAATCTLTARAAGRDFTVEIVADDTASVLA